MSREKYIVLMGMKHSGKSTLGKLLGTKFNTPFVDLDDLIEETYKSESAGSNNLNSLTCRQIYLKHGKSFFMEIEARAAARLLTLPFKGGIIVALGGGTIENPDALSFLPAEWLFVYLEAKKEELFERIKNRGLPPFLNTADPLGTFSALYLKRTALYEKKADIIVNLFGKGLKESFNTLITSLEEKGYAR